MSAAVVLTPAQVSALTALALADGDEYLFGLLSSAVWCDEAGARHIRSESYAAQRLAVIAAELEAV